MINERRMPLAWRDRIMSASAWAFMVRPSRVRLPEDVLTRQVRLPAVDGETESGLSAQSRLVEILQMLRFKAAAYAEDWSKAPPLCVLLSCYDELNTEIAPGQYCNLHLPLFSAYLAAHWPNDRVRVFGVSPLGQALSDSDPDDSYVAKGPDKMGYVVDQDGERTIDLLAPMHWMLCASARG